MPRILFGPYQPDVASVYTQGTSYVHNVIPNSSGYGPLRDLLAFADALPSRCLGMFGVIDDDNTAHLFAGTATKLYKLNATTRAWADVTRASGGDYSVGAREYWDFEIFGQNVVAVTSSNNPQVYTLGSSSAFANLAGSPPQARRVAVVGDFLVLAGLTANPNRIHWSALNDITGWTPGTDSSDYQDFPDGGYTYDLAGGEFGLVFQENAIRRMIFNPNSAAIFDFSRISDNRGLLMPYSVVKLHSVAFFYSSDGFYRIDGQGMLAPIGENRIDQTFFDDFDNSNPRFLLGMADPKSTRIFWAYKSVGNGDSSFLDKLLIYDWQRNQWSQGEISVQFLCSSSPLGTTLESLDSEGDLDSLEFSLDLYAQVPSFSLTGVTTENKPGYFTGDALEATFDIAEQSIGKGGRMFVRSVGPVSDATSAYVKVGYRDRLGDTKSYSTEAAINYRGFSSLRANGRYFTTRVRIPAGATWTWARGVDIDAVPIGVR